MLDLLNYDFFLKALFTALFTSISCGIIGTYIVSKKIVFISGGISHASFGGIGIGYFFNINPVFSAIIFALFSAISISLLSKKSRINIDSLIGILWSFGMATGIIFIYLTPGYTPNLKSYLFGNILTVSYIDIYLLSSVTILVIITFLLLFKEILFIAFDEEYAQTQKIPVNTLNVILLCLTAVTIVVNIRVVGIILVISLLTIPQAIAGLFSKEFKKTLLLSIGFGLIGTITGLFLSHKLKIPSGASIIFSLILLYIILSLIKTFTQKLQTKN